MYTQAQSSCLLLCPSGSASTRRRTQLAVGSQKPPRQQLLPSKCRTVRQPAFSQGTRSRQCIRGRRGRISIAASISGASSATAPEAYSSQEPEFAALPASVPTRWRRAVVFIALSMLACNLDRTALAVAGARPRATCSLPVHVAHLAQVVASPRRCSEHGDYTHRSAHTGGVRLYSWRDGRSAVIVFVGILLGADSVWNPGRQVGDVPSVPLCKRALCRSAHFLTRNCLAEHSGTVDRR